MGDCIYCHKPAGLFRSFHRECQQRREAEMVAEIEAQDERRIKADRFALDLTAAMSNLSTPLIQIDEMVARGMEEEIIGSADRQRLLVSAWQSAVDHFLDDDLLSDEEEQRLNEAIDRFLLPPAALEQNGALSRLGKASILKKIFNGEIPTVDAGPLPVNLQKSEKLVWAEKDVRYLEDKVRRKIVGHSRGVSVRVMRGVYARLGAFEGEPVYNTERVEVATGILFVTDRNLYFYSSNHSIRIPFRKIVSFEKFSNGLGIIRDAATAKPQIFVNDDGWFLYNLVTTLAGRED